MTIFTIPSSVLGARKALTIHHVISISANTLVIDEDLVGTAARSVNDALISTLRAVEYFTVSTDLAAAINEVSFMRADAHDTVPHSIVTAGSGHGLTLVAHFVQLESSATGHGGSTLISIPHSSRWARSTCVNGRLVEANAASA